MVQRRQSKPEHVTNAPYFYPSFSRYNTPRKNGDDEDVYSEPTFEFPHWDDELHASASTPTQRKQTFQWNDASLPFGEDDVSDGKGEKSKYLPEELEDEEDAEDHGDIVKCDDLRQNLTAARHDAKADYDRFKLHFSSLSDELRQLQREIEAAEQLCMHRHSADAKDGSQASSPVFGSPIPSLTAIGIGPSPYHSVSSSPTSRSNNPTGAISDSPRRVLLSSPSAMQAATEAYRNRSIPSSFQLSPPNQSRLATTTMATTTTTTTRTTTIMDKMGNSNGQSTPGNRTNGRCAGLDDGWTQDRVPQNEWISC